MITVQEGQCGLCTHFGEGHGKTPKLVEIQSTHQAAPELVDDCGHLKLASLHLKLTLVSGCDGFSPAMVA